MPDETGEIADEKPSKKGKTKASKSKAKQAARREIPGNLPYTTTAGTLKRILEKIITAERPGKVNYDFLDTVLGFSGGSAKQALSLLRRAGLIASDGSPSDVYAKFKTESGRSAAALSALRTGFAEIFKRNEHAHKANGSKLADIVVEVTGLSKTDPVARAIIGSFQVFQSFVKEGAEASADDQRSEIPADTGQQAQDNNGTNGGGLSNLGISYQINIVLPETSNVDVFNAIFKSLRENLLR